MAFRDAIIVDKLFVLKDNIVLTTKHTGSKITNTKRSIVLEFSIEDITEPSTDKFKILIDSEWKIVSSKYIVISNEWKEVVDYWVVIEGIWKC